MRRCNVTAEETGSTGTEEMRLKRAFRKLEGEIRAVPASEYAMITVDIQGAVALALAAVPRLRELRPTVTEMLKVDLKLYDELEDYALALAYAHGAYLVATAPVSLEETGREATDVRRVLMSDAQALATRGLIDGARLREIGGRLGYRNTAFDLIGLVQVLRDAWPEIQGKTPMTLDELENAEVLANQLLIEVGERDGPRRVVSEALRDRAAAFTLFSRAYQFAQRVLRFVRHDEGDADLILPSLHADKGRRRATPDSAEETVDELPLPPPANEAPPAEALSAPSGSNPPSDSTAPAQSMVRGPVLGEEFPAQAAGMPGLPGVDPFKD